MAFPVTVSVVTLEIASISLSDTKPTPPEGYEVALVKDLGYTNMWMIFKVTAI